MKGLQKGMGWRELLFYWDEDRTWGTHCEEVYTVKKLARDVATCISQKEP